MGQHEHPGAPRAGGLGTHRGFSSLWEVLVCFCPASGQSVGVACVAKNPPNHFSQHRSPKRGSLTPQQGSLTPKEQPWPVGSHWDHTNRFCEFTLSSF